MRWQGPLRGTLQLSRTNAFFLGGGKALVNAYYQLAEHLGVDVRYETEVTRLRTLGGRHDRRVRGCRARRGRSQAKSVVVASGGFEANLEWLAQYWGEAAQNFAIRGTRYNRGGPLQTLIDRGAKAIGNPHEFHAVAVDARGPQFDGGIVTRLDTVPFGIVVNRDGLRFSDEGADFWPKRYASWGGLIARQPGQIAFSILDAKMANEFMPSLYPPVEAQSVPRAGARAGAGAGGGRSDRRRVQRRGAGRDVRPDDPGRLPHAGAGDTEEPLGATHRHAAVPRLPAAHRASRSPIAAWPWTSARGCSSQAGQPLPGFFAAGEAMAGNILGRGYLAGFGMTIGSVFGRIAGREAAKHALA